MVIRLIIVLVSLLWALSAQAATYFISPTGVDSGSGTSSSAPWLTFAYAFSHMSAGDTLTLLNGTYTSANSGYINITCGSNAPQGTSGAQVTVQAQNDRQA